MGRSCCEDRGRRLKQPPERYPEGRLVPRSTSVHCRQLWDDYGDPEQFETPCEQTMNDPSKDFLRISCAVNRLSAGMWGGLQRPDPVAAIKQEPDHKKLLLRFG